MIRILGIKRIFVLLVLVGLNVLFAAVLYMYIAPEKLNKERELRGLRGKVSSLSSDIDRMQVEFEQLEDQRREFEALKKRGFFQDQGRRQAELIFKRIQDESRVISAVASVGAGTFEHSDEAQKAKHKILLSPVDIKIKAMDDVDVFRYLYLLEEFFPGHIAIEKIVLSREAEVTGTVLRSIAAGGNPELVLAEIKAFWRTMIPEDRASATEGDEGGVAR